MRTVYSYGIACFRQNCGRYEVLLVNKRNTYAFLEFVRGKYKSDRDIDALFARMTIEEKVDIMSMNFDRMWYRAWLCDARFEESARYEVARKKFTEHFARDSYLNAFNPSASWYRHQNKLAERMSHAPSVDKLWEIPKGHKKTQAELELDCAIREFYEETGLQKNEYRIVPGRTVKCEHTDNDIKYVSKYFIAQLTDPESSRVRVSLTNASQICEICDIHWFSAEAIGHVPGCERAAPIVRGVIKKAKRASLPPVTRIIYRVQPDHGVVKLPGR